MTEKRGKDIFFDNQTHSIEGAKKNNDEIIKERSVSAEKKKPNISFCWKIAFVDICRNAVNSTICVRNLFFIQLNFFRVEADKVKGVVS